MFWFVTFVCSSFRRFCDVRPLFSLRVSRYIHDADDRTLIVLRISRPRFHYIPTSPNTNNKSQDPGAGRCSRAPDPATVVSWPKQATWEDLTPWPAEASMLSRAAQAPFSPFLDSRNELEVRPEHGGHQKTLTFSFFYFSVFSE